MDVGQSERILEVNKKVLVFVPSEENNRSLVFSMSLWDAVA